MSQYVQEKERKKIKLENPVAHREFIFSIIPTADKWARIIIFFPSHNCPNHEDY